MHYAINDIIGSVLFGTISQFSAFDREIISSSKRCKNLFYNERSPMKEFLISSGRIIDCLNDGIYVCDRDRRIVFWSKSAERITGVTTNIPIIVFALCKDGRRVPTQATTAPIHNEAGEIIGGVETFHDVTPIMFDPEGAQKIQRQTLQHDLPGDPRCGSPAIHDLQQIVSAAEGVYGSRCSGSGFGGCVIGFVKPTHAAAVAKHICKAYGKQHPEVADQAAVYLAETADGAHFL
jgi:hypothetical protein